MGLKKIRLLDKKYIQTTIVCQGDFLDKDLFIIRIKTQEGQKTGVVVQAEHNRFHMVHEEKGKIHQFDRDNNIGSALSCEAAYRGKMVYLFTMW
jgi:hypothetical protein